jgi:hypothetical protein
MPCYSTIKGTNGLDYVAGHVCQAAPTSTCTKRAARAASRMTEAAKMGTDGQGLTLSTSQLNLSRF